MLLRHRGRLPCDVIEHVVQNIEGRENPLDRRGREIQRFFLRKSVHRGREDEEHRRQSNDEPSE